MYQERGGRTINEKYNIDSINFLKELYEREDKESKILKRKRDISRSSDYNEMITYHEWHKKLIKYLIVTARRCGSNTGNSTSDIGSSASDTHMSAVSRTEQRQI